MYRGLIIDGYPISDLKECWINVYKDRVLGHAHPSVEQAIHALSFSRKLYRIHVKLKNV